MLKMYWMSEYNKVAAADVDVWEKKRGWTKIKKRRLVTATRLTFVRHCSHVMTSFLQEQAGAPIHDIVLCVSPT